jgi:DnaJ-domain-containing protein 1
MKSQFNVHRGSCSTAQESYDGASAFEERRPEHAWQFVDDVERLLGDNAQPDTLFFVESWTVGVPAAIENWQQRRLEQADHKSLNRGYREPVSIETAPFVQESALYAEFLSSARAAANAERYDAGWSQQSPEGSATQTQDQAPRESDGFAEECDCSHDTIHPMTQRRACQLLGVNATSTQKQIKAAYRQRVSQWHPDRLENRTDGVRLLATEQMAAINEAYRLLRDGLLYKSA